MSIDPFAPGLISSRTTGSMFVSLRAQLDDLQRQLSSGKKSESFGGLGFGRRISLDFRSRLAMIEGFQNNIQSANVRLSLMNQSLESIAKLARDGKSTALQSDFTPGTDGLTIGQRLAQESLKEMIDVLNSDVAGRYIFAGRATDTKPVEGYDLILNGDTTHAGLKQLINERTQADLGTNGLGRLNLTNVAANVTLAEQLAGLPFGFKIAGASADGGNITATYAGGPPASAAFDITLQPSDGDAVHLVLNLPDGTQEKLDLVARTTIDPLKAEKAFQIGPTPNATAANLAALVQSEVSKLAATSLKASSAEVAAADFFAGSVSNPPLRVNGPPFDTATTTVAGTAANTVIWYKGDDTSLSARGTAPVRVDVTQTVATGSQANEEAFRAMFAQFGILSSLTFSASDPNAEPTYTALSDRVNTKLSFPPGTQSVEEIATELALATATIANAKERNKTTTSLLQTSVDDVENASSEQVAAAILALQTRLQASYQTTAILSQLSLTNYL
jgi:flagellin-like hook-associated protein FlgL